MAALVPLPPDDSSRLDYYGAFSHAIDVKDLKPGDHIYCHKSPFFFYSHHGIYIGEPDCEVIHFSGTSDSKLGSQSSSDSSLDDETRQLLQELQTLPKDSERAKEIEKKLKICIKSTTLAEFLNGSTLRLVAYGCSGFKHSVSLVSSHSVKAMPPSETVKLAKHFHDHSEEWNEYHLSYNNCETFATFCKTGRLDLAAQLYQIVRNVAFERNIGPTCQTAEEALIKYQVEDDSAIRVGVTSHAIDKERLKPGDQIYCYRNICTHHGIYIGEPDCEVIHFSGASRINSTTLAEFQYGSTLRLVAYGYSGIKHLFAIVSSHYIKAMPPSETVKLAKHFRDHAEEWGEYHLKHNNSERFACFCKTGLLDIAAQFHQFERSVFTERRKEPCKTSEEALEKYRERN
uniref:LRAT domain-containing protein n=1 Tax=Amphimedon queenslandica TaxID=400682 RepID=A0A1X7UAB0_AMPQE